MFFKLLSCLCLALLTSCVVLEQPTKQTVCNKTEEEKLSFALLEPYALKIPSNLSDIKIEGKLNQYKDNFGNEVSNNVFTTMGVNF